MTTKQIDAARHTARIEALVGIEDAVRLRSIARSLHRLSEAQCNGYQDWRGNWDEAAEKRAEAREEKLEAKATAIAKAHGLNLYVQGDPRGAPLYLWSQADKDTRTGGAWREYPIDSCYSSIGTAIY